MLMTSFIIFVNEEWGPKRMTMKYFEPCHSFMKCRRRFTLKQVRFGIRRQKFKDFIDIQLVRLTKKMMCSKCHQTIFFKFKNGCKMHNKSAANVNIILILDNIRSVQFRKGSRSMFYKENIDDVEYKESSFLTKKIKLEIPDRGSEDRGINSDKQEKIKK